MDSSESKACCIPVRKNARVVASAPLSVSGNQPMPIPDKIPSVRPIEFDTASIGDVWFNMGSNHPSHPQDGEAPVRRVWVDRFELATTAVRNVEFKQFVSNTGYVTDAERAGSSFVFHLLLAGATTQMPASAIAPWWSDVPGACWHTPEGEASTIEERLDHPVVHISRNDALHFCLWSGARLATEAEWECAARGGLESQPYPWGAELNPNGEHRCNIWQGEFPTSNTVDDGYVGTAPADAFMPNGYGLFNMTGNVWEWVADRYSNMHSPRDVKNPKGPLNGDTYVAKGGSYLCHASYCLRYRTSSRQALSASVTAGNVGFRVALSNFGD